MDDLEIKEEEIEISDVDIEEISDVDVCEFTSEVEDRKETKGVDFTVCDEGYWHEIDTSTVSNPLTSALVEVENPPNLKFYDEFLKFRKGYNMFALIMYWGQIDQKCLRLWRLMRLMAVLNMLK